MTTTFKKAVREGVGVLIMLAGGTGSGKTKTALRLASGMSLGKRFAFLDSENRRGLHYADAHDFDYAELREPFSPEAYQEACRDADKAGYPVIVIDSFSHEWSGYGGVLDLQEAELDRMAGSDWKKREACKMAAWIKPKMAHKAMVQSFLQLRAHVIVCMRAEPKIDIIREDGKTKIIPKESLVGHAGWIPVTEKNFPFEATISFMFTADRPGYPIPIKLQDQHKPFFPLDRQVNEDSGQAISKWALGGPDTATPTAAPTSDRASAALAKLRDVAREKAGHGTEALQAWLDKLSPAQRGALGPDLLTLQKDAREADTGATASEQTTEEWLDANESGSSA